MFTVFLWIVSSLLLGLTKPTSAELIYLGHDLSSLRILELGGAIYHDSARDNETRPAEDILGDGGANTIRLRCVPFKL